MVDLTSAEKEIFAQHKLTHRLRYDAFLSLFSPDFIDLARRRWFVACGFVCVYGCVCLAGCKHVVWVCCKDLERRNGSSLFWDMKETGILEESIGSGGLASFIFSFLCISHWLSYMHFFFHRFGWIVLLGFAFLDKGLNLLIVMWFWILGFDD